MKTTTKAPKMTSDECRAALDAARATLTTCERNATLLSDWDTLKALKTARATVADLQTQWDRMQPAPVEPEPSAQPKAKPEPEPPSPEMLRMVKGFEKAVYGFALEDETVQGANVQQVARECVDLSVAFSPVIPSPNGFPAEVESTNGGKMYRVKTPHLPGGYVNATPDELKVMRARYILTRNSKYQDLQAGKHPGYDDQALFSALFPDGVIIFSRPKPKDADITETKTPQVTPAEEPIDPTGATTDKTMARLKFGWLLRAMGQDAAVKTDGWLDEQKLKRVCNEILRGVASDRPSPTINGWEAAAHLHSERNGYVWHEETKKWEKSE